MNRQKMNDNTPEQQKLFDAVDKFAVEMKKRLLEKHNQGWEGWENLPCDYGGRRLLMNAAKGIVKKDKKSLVDTANLAMMLHRNKG